MFKHYSQNKVNKMAKFCTNCGNKLEAGEKKCLNCGQEINSTPEVKKMPQNTNNNKSSRSKIVAGLLAIFLGVFGVHNFYLGYTDKAIPQLLLGTAGAILCGIGPIISSIWGFAEGIMILTGSIDKDADGLELVD